MASKSAVPSHLKADNGSDRHHGKTQSHVVCTEHSFFSNLPVSLWSGQRWQQQQQQQQKWQLATEHEASEHLSNTAGDDDGRILCTQQTRQILALLSI